MTTELRIVLIIASFLTSALMLRRIRRSKVRIEDSVFWIGLSVVILIMSVFPQIADACAAALHIYQTTNFLFMFFIFVLLIKLFAMSVHVSQLESKLDQTIQEQALSTYVLEDQASETTVMRENAQQEAVSPHKAAVSQESTQCATWENNNDATTQNAIEKETVTQTYAGTKDNRHEERPIRTTRLPELTSHDYRAYDVPRGKHVSTLNDKPAAKSNSALNNTPSRTARSEDDSEFDQKAQEDYNENRVFEQGKLSNIKRVPHALSYCFFSALYAPHVGGVEAYTAGLAGELASRGNAVTIVTNQLSPNNPECEIQTNGVEVVRLPCHPLLNGRLPLPHRNNAYQRTFDDLASRGFDRVVVNTRFYSLSLEGARFAQRIGAPALIIEHGSAHLSLGNHFVDRLVEAYEHRATERMKACDFSFCAVSRAAEKWLKHFNIASVGVVSNAIDIEAFRASASQRDFRHELGCDESDFLVAFVGRLIPEKGVEALLQAAHMLSGITSPLDDGETSGKQDTNAAQQFLARHTKNSIDNSKSVKTAAPNAHLSTNHLPSPLPHMTFAFAGEGPLLSAVQQTKNAHALGRLCSKDVAALLSSADVVCLPSRSEGFATTLLEAAAMSTAPVVTKVGGVEELAIANGCGYVLPNTKPTTIAATLLQTYDNRADCKTRGARLHERAIRQISWAHTADVLETLFDDYNTKPSLETGQSSLKDSSL